MSVAVHHIKPRPTPRPSWLHVASHVVVCRRCHGDPYADEGEAGRRAAEQLERRLRRERGEAFVA